MWTQFVLVCLGLMVSNTAALQDELRTKFHISPGTLLANFLIAPDVHEGRETFAVLEYEEVPNQSQKELLVKLRMYDDHLGAQARECAMNFRGRNDAKKLGAGALRRLRDDKVVFTWYDELSNSFDRRTRLVAVNIKNCYQFSLEPREVSGNPIVAPSVDDSFDVFVDDPGYCKKWGNRCRISFDLSDSAFGRSFDFNVTMDWSTLYVERLPSGAFLVRGFDGNDYKVAQMNHLTRQIDVLILIPQANRQMEVVSSGLSICWVMRPGVDSSVSCEKFSDSRQLIFSEIVKYNEAVRLIDVHPVRYDEVFLVTRRANCANEKDCWHMFGTKIQRGQTNFEHVPIKFFNCTGDQSQLTVFDATPDDKYLKMDFNYACRNNNSYTFSTFFIY